ncbi:MAG: 50S ribosomal protein L2 [Candidatus Falkowbacteria bacterium]
MGIIKVKPTINSRRSVSYSDFAEITKTTPEKRLIIAKRRKGGRNNQGKITVRHKGGGAKRAIRIVDYKRDKYEVPGKVAAIEYDPNRGARLALIFYTDGEKRYIIAPVELNVGATIVSSKEQIEILPGNAMPVKFIPAGVMIYNIELQPGQGGKIARGAGTGVRVMGVEGKFAQIKMPSGEIRLIKKECLCSIGQVSNPDKSNVSLGNAGRSRHLGIRPTVRGTAMNPNDHPHGGGEGNQPIGLRYPKTKWGKHALGVKTRRTKKASTKLIVQRRKKKSR